MFDPTQPRARGPYSIAAATIGRRLSLARGRGSDDAALVWLVILSHTPWDGSQRPTWASNVTLAHETGLDLNRVEYAVAQLRSAGMITTPHGERPRARRKWGRLLVPVLDSPVKVTVPDRAAMANIWPICREARPRPAALVTAMVGAHVLASHEHGSAPDDWAPIGAKAADLRRFVGASKGSTWGRRINDLCDLGLLERRDQLWVAPTSEWSTTARAMARVRSA